MAHLHFEFLQYGEAVTLIDLRTTVDLDDFHGVLCFARGDIDKKRRESWDQGKRQRFSIVSWWHHPSSILVFGDDSEAGKRSASFIAGWTNDHLIPPPGHGSAINHDSRIPGLKVSGKLDLH